VPSVRRGPRLDILSFEKHPQVMKAASVALILASMISVSFAESPVQPREKTRSPEEVIRSFFMAMMSNDEEGILREIIPHPQAEILWEGETIPPEILSNIKKQMGSMTFTECTVGELLELPDAENLKVTAQMVNEENKLMFPVIDGQPAPTPLAVKRIEGEWKIDASPLIISRNAAKLLRQKEDPAEGIIQ
jgi:hypothetical protein